LSSFESVGNIIKANLKMLNPKIEKKIGIVQIMRNWENFVGDDAAEILPVSFENGILTLYSANPLLNDKYKYLIPDLIEKINENFGADFVKKISFGKTFQAQNVNGERFKPNEKPEKVEQEVFLTEEELDECKKKAESVKNPDIYDMILGMLIAQKKADKWKIQNGWHKCAVCDNLCEPDEFFCFLCSVNEPKKMSKLIREIFAAAPHTEFKTVKKKVLAKMPHMKKFCQDDVIEAARMDLIQQTASRLAYGDEDSPRAKFLVMLVNQLREEELTEQIIKQTLNTFRFDLAERPEFLTRRLEPAKKSGRKKKV